MINLKYFCSIRPLWKIDRPLRAFHFWKHLTIFFCFFPEIPTKFSLGIIGAGKKNLSSM
jgi:hypothetical protein